MANLSKTVRRSIKRVTTSGRNALLEHSPQWVRASLGPLASYLDMLFVDHGVFRIVYLNRHMLGSNAWRAAQPAPHQIATIASLGVRTIVNLRGERLCGSFWLEEAACKRHGIELVNFQVRSRAAPSKDELRGVRDLFQRITYPMLLHCKSGADRAGLVSVLYLHLVEDVPLAQAKKQLSLKFGHIRQADTGVLDHFFEAYLAYAEITPISFFDWVETIYDPVALQANFKANGMANRIVNSVLRRE